MDTVTLVVGVCYGVIIVLGIPGNLWVTYIITRYRGMRTVTSLFLLSLATANIVYLIMLAFATHSMLKQAWLFGVTMCITYQTLLSVSLTAHALTLIAMTLERCVPRGVVTLTGSTQLLLTGVTCVCVWVVSVLASVPSMIYSRLVQYTRDPDDGGSCMLSRPYLYKAYLSEAQHDALVYSFIPAVILVVLSIIAVTVGRCTTHGVHSSARWQVERQVTWLVVAVNAVFVVCDIPYHMMLFIHIRASQRVVTDIWMALVALSVMNAMLQPLLYPLVNVTFRKFYVMAVKCKPDTEVNEVLPEETVAENNGKEHVVMTSQ